MLREVAMLRDLTPRKTLGVALLIGVLAGAALYVYTQWFEPARGLLEALDHRFRWGTHFRTTGLATAVRCALDTACQSNFGLLPRFIKQPLPVPATYLGYGALAVLVLSAIFLRPTARVSAYTDNWASAHDRALLRVRGLGPLESAISLARLGRTFLALKLHDPHRATRELGHVLVVAPSRRGKTLHLIANLLCWRHSAVVLDIKGELFRVTSRRRSVLSRVWVLDPDSGEGHQYDPFKDLAQSETGIQSAAALIMRPDGDPNPIFGQRAMMVLSALIRVAQIEDRPTLHVIHEYIRGLSLPEFIARLRDYPDARVRADLVDFLATVAPNNLPADLFQDRFLVSVWGSLKTRLTPYFSESILQMCGGSDFKATDLVNAPSTLYLRFSESEGEASRDILALVVLGITIGLMRDADRAPRADRTPLLLALDEAGRTPIPRLADLMATVAGRGISVLLYVQSVAQLTAAYGRDGARTIVDNCHTTLYYRPLHLDTAREISATLGQRSVTDVRESHQRGSLVGGPETVSEGERGHALMTPTELQRMRDGTVILLTDGRRPIRAQRVNYLEYPQMRAWARLTPLPLPQLSPPPALTVVNRPTARPAADANTPASPYLEPLE